MVCCLTYRLRVAYLTDLLCLLQPRHSSKLLSVLRQMPQRSSPDTFFMFPGKTNSVGGQPSPVPVAMPSSSVEDWA